MRVLNGGRRRGGWVAAAGLALTNAVLFGLLFFRQFALGQRPELAWALAAAGWFPAAAAIAFWTLASARGGPLPRMRWRIALTALMLLGGFGCLMFAFRLFAERLGGFA